MPAEPGEALWLRFRLQPDKHEQILRVFAPDLARLDLYVLDDHRLISEAATGNTLPQTEKPLSSSDYLLPLPQATASGYFIRAWCLNTSCARTLPSVPPSCLLPTKASLLGVLLLGCLAMLVLHNLDAPS